MFSFGALRVWRERLRVLEPLVSLREGSLLPLDGGPAGESTEATVVAWSTSQLAEIAGTTVKAIRHYHETGLLEEPERDTNNYQQYRVSHLVRLPKITPLTDLDVSLSQIPLMGHGDYLPEVTLRPLDARLAATIERLGRIRVELKLILLHQSSTDLPIGFGPVSSSLSEADRDLILIYSRVLGSTEMHDLLQMLLDLAGNPIHKAFDALAADAATATRQSLAESYAPPTTAPSPSVTLGCGI